MCAFATYSESFDSCAESLRAQLHCAESPHAQMGCAELAPNLL